MELHGTICPVRLENSCICFWSKFSVLPFSFLFSKSIRYPWLVFRVFCNLITRFWMWYDVKILDDVFFTDAFLSSWWYHCGVFSHVSNILIKSKSTLTVNVDYTVLCCVLSSKKICTGLVNALNSTIKPGTRITTYLLCEFVKPRPYLYMNAKRTWKRMRNA